MKMDLHAAVRAHTDWVVELVDGFEPDAGVSPDEIERHDACEIGRWIERNAERFGGVPAFRALDGVHRKVHGCAAVIARAVAAGDILAGAEYEMRCGRESEELLGAFADFFDAAEAAGLSLSEED